MSMTVDLNALVNTETVLLHHQGAVDKMVVLDMLAQMEDILEAEGIERQKKRKLINIAIETLQNLQLHAFLSSEVDESLQANFFLARSEGKINIIIGNLIAKSETIVLEDKLNKINSLNDEEVKFLYGVIMKQTVIKFSSKGGAGLGLIDMKKKSDNPLDYCFQPVDNNLSYFSLRVKVDI